MYTFVTSLKRYHLVIICLVALLIRALTFYTYIGVQERYKQPDSNDYHLATLSISHGFGMSQLGTGEPYFWRTPGYPMYLLPFYKLFPPTDYQFTSAARAQRSAIWFQICINAIIPLLLFYLALMLTGLPTIAYIVAWVSAVHVGFVLISTYLLTEGIALIFFYLFLYYFYMSFRSLTPLVVNNRWKKQSVLVASFFLALYSWVRPMGVYVAIVSAIIIALFGQDNVAAKLKKIAAFLGLFFLLLSPWYIRNYLLTGHLFFCPMFGAYLNSFCAPRIISSLYGIDLLQAWRQLGYAAHSRYEELRPIYNKIGMYIPKEFVCGQFAWSICLSHPGLLLLEWMREVFKTTFDLYSYQLVAFVEGSFFYDPLIEYISDKFANCLYKTDMSLFMRLIVHIEMLYTLALWIGLIIGFYYFIIQLLLKRRVNQQIKKHLTLWLCLAPMIGAVIFMTGGFGYARLRLPIEPLLLILSLDSWFWWMKRMK